VQTFAVKISAVAYFKNNKLTVLIFGTCVFLHADEKVIKMLTGQYYRDLDLDLNHESTTIKSTTLTYEYISRDLSQFSVTYM